jgi:hypothetical protein
MRKKAHASAKLQMPLAGKDLRPQGRKQSNHNKNPHKKFLCGFDLV